MREVVIADYLRSAFSRSRPRQPERDKFNSLRVDHIAAMLIEKIVERNKVDPRDIGEVQVSSAFGVWEQWTYGGRSVVLLAHLPVEVPAVFVDKQCGSSMTAAHVGAMEIMTGYTDMTIACGMEHLTRVPMGVENQWISPPMDLATEDVYKHYDMETGFFMGNTAEKLFKEGAEKYGITREDMDKWALRSHQLATKAQGEGFFKDEILPVEVTLPDGSKEVVDLDLSVRSTTTLDKIQSLPPAFKEDGVVTAGNSSPLNAGASCMMLTSKEKAKELGITPLATIRALGWAAVPPAVMGKGPVPASRKALKHAGLEVRDIDFWEINESFSIVALNAANKLGIDYENKMNIHGGALAIGNPASATGLRITTTLARILKEKKAKYGLAAMSCGGGQGTAVVIENLDL